MAPGGPRRLPILVDIRRDRRLGGHGAQRARSDLRIVRTGLCEYEDRGKRGGEDRERDLRQRRVFHDVPPTSTLPPTIVDRCCREPTEPGRSRAARGHPEHGVSLTLATALTLATVVAFLGARAMNQWSGLRGRTKAST